MNLPQFLVTTGSLGLIAGIIWVLLAQAQPYHEGQEDQVAALGFALNVLVLWNTQYMDDAIGHLRRSGREISDEHLARLSPLQHEHILMLGTFPFTLPHELADGQRRRLRIGDGSA